MTQDMTMQDQDVRTQDSRTLGLEASTDQDLITQDPQDRAAQSSPADQVALTPTAVIPLLIGSTVTEVEQELVLQTLARCDGNRTRAARLLGVSVRTLRNKIRQYAAGGFDVPESGQP
jgi:DNA-binding NtrC family response regulator